MQKISALLHDLVAINSINPDLVAGAPGEGEIARFVADWLRRKGVEVTIDEPRPERPNVVGVVHGSGGGRSLLLNAHMDTVGVVGMERPHQPFTTEGRLYGRGAYDMKAGLAAIMMAAAGAGALNLRGDVILTAVVDEEYASIGTSAIAGRWRADAAIVSEPTELDICVAHKGFIWLEVETGGSAAHGSRPDLGIDAIVKMGKVLVGLEKLDRSLREHPSHPLLQSGSVHAALITGGQELSSYPERCRLSVERRTVPGETRDSVEAEMQRIFAAIAASDADFRASLKFTLARDAFEVALDEPIVQTVLGAARARAQDERGPQVSAVSAWMDSALLAAAGIPTVIFGPGGAGAHAVVEWADLDQLERGAQVLLDVVKDFCA